MVATLSADAVSPRVLSGDDAQRAVPAWSTPTPAVRDAVKLTPALQAVVDAEVERQLGRLGDDARRRAQTEGHAEGMDAAHDELGRLLVLLDEAGRRSSDDAAEALTELAASATDLALEISAAILERERTEDPSVVLVPVRSALLELAGDARLRLHLHPDDLARLRDAGELPPTVDCRPDPALPPGDCRVESASRVAHDGLTHRLDRIREAIAC